MVRTTCFMILIYTKMDVYEAYNNLQMRNISSPIYRDAEFLDFFLHNSFLSQNW